MSRDFVAASSDHLEYDGAVLTDMPLTMACWYKPDAVVGDESLISLGKASTTDHYRLWVSAGTCYAYQQKAGAGTAQASVAGVSAGAWQFFGAIFASATDRRAFLGATRGSNTDSLAAPATPDRTSIGRRVQNSAGSQYADGFIGEGAIWNIALSDANMASLAGGAPADSVEPDHLVAWWRIRSNANPEPDDAGAFDIAVVGADFSTDDPPVFAAQVVLTATQGQTATLATSKTYVQALTATQAQTGTLTRLRNLLKSLTATQGQTATLATAKLPIPTAVVPSSDRTTGGAAVIIAGSSFQAGATVTIGGTPATSVVFVSATRLTAVVPAHAAGVVDVVVTNPDATVGTLASGFTFYTPAALDTSLVADFGGLALPLKVGSVSVSEDASRGSASFQSHSARPVPFTPVRIGLGSLADNDLIIRGKQQVTTQSQLGQRAANKQWDGTVADSSAEFNRYLAWGTYTSVAADVVGLDLLAKFAPDFTGVHVASGLPTVTLILEGVTMDSAFNSLARAIGGYYYRDNSYDVHLFITETPDLTPDALDAANTTCLKGSLSWVADTSQVRNRVIGIGANTQVLSPLNAGETIVPIADATIFDDAIGKVLLGAQRVSYTSKVAGGLGTVVGTGAGPSAAPGLALAAGLGLELGAYKYAYVDVTPSGKSLPSPLASITTTAGAGDPTTIGTAFKQEYDAGGVDVPVTYKYTFRRDSDGTETAPSPATASLNCGHARVEIPLSGCESAPAGYTRRWWRSDSSGAYRLMPPSLNPSLWLEYPATNTFIDTVPHAAAAWSGTPTIPSSNGTGGRQVQVSAILAGPSPTTTRELYRTAVGGSQLKFVVDLGNNTTLTYLDAVPDASLGANAPTSDTSGLPGSPSGKVLAGATSMIAASPGLFPTSGWVIAGKQVIRYTGISGSTFTGIPASGFGSIQGTLVYGSSLLSAPMLLGVPASGDWSIAHPVPSNALVSLYAEVDDAISQATVAAIEGGKSTGVYEFKIVDTSLATQAALNARCAADRFQYSSAEGIITVTYTTFDKKSRVGRPVHIDLPEYNLVGDFVIQRVEISEINVSNQAMPRYAVTASSVRFSFEDVLRHMVVQQ